MLLVLALFPIAIYLAILGWINRRPRGCVVSGTWDFAGILFAASGFLLLGGPALLGMIAHTDAWRQFWILGRLNEEAPPEQRLVLGRVLLHLAYFVVVLALAGWLLWRRRRWTVVYNVDPRVVESVLGQTFARWGLPFVQTGHVLLIDPAKPPTLPQGENAAPPPEPGAILVDRLTTLAVEAALGMWHVTLRWDPPGSLLRKEVELQLRRELAEIDAPGGAVGDWLLLAACSLFLLLFLGAGVLILLKYVRV